ncbi:hypothetical protein CRUP_021030 [Coryphaenoides rupestris]|nr:hypothetical protein CRUP_021030 [Coryphaenoides rupestris]
MRQMMRSFSDPFSGGLFAPSLTDGRDRRRAAPAHPGTHPGTHLGTQPGTYPGTALALRDEHRDTDMRNPFSMLDNMMLNMRTRMDDMHKNFVGNEPPKVFQASSQTRRAPGGYVTQPASRYTTRPPASARAVNHRSLYVVPSVLTNITETRRALKDSESGLEKMAIGHHIQDRGHVVEKKHNKKTGEKELNQDFQNMDESEAQSFDEEWQSELSKFQPSVPISRLEAPRPPRAAHRAALTAPEQPHRERKVRIADGRKQAPSDKVKGSGVAQP